MCLTSLGVERHCPGELVGDRAEDRDLGDRAEGRDPGDRAEGRDRSSWTWARPLDCLTMSVFWVGAGLHR